MPASGGVCALEGAWIELEVHVSLESWKRLREKGNFQLESLVVWLCIKQKQHRCTQVACT